VRWVVALFIGLLLASCGDTPSLPAAPSELTSGLIVYKDANYQGAAGAVAQSIEDLSSWAGWCEHNTYGGSTSHDWDDCISSIRVAAGWRATIYTERKFKGNSAEIASDVSNLQLVPGDCEHEGLNDCISSIRVISP
jgi:hypothetical protein